MQKTIVCSFKNANKGKLEEVKNEFEKAQSYISGKDAEIYSATRQQMERKAGDEGTQPLFLRNDTFQIDNRETELVNYWVKIPVASTHGGIWMPIEPHEEINTDWSFGDSKIVKKEHGFEFHLSVKKEVEEMSEYEGALGIDLGLRKLATATDVPLSKNSQTLCLGSQIENYTDKYFYLRRKASNGYVRKRWDKKVSNKTEDLCHQISRRIVDHAKEKNLFIVIGNLEGIQDQDLGRKMNRKLTDFPHWKLRNYIRYKAEWEGIKVVEVDEAYTSQTCSKCGEKGNRHKGTFDCPRCGYETDADKNASQNIGKRGIGKLKEASSDSRGCVTQPIIHS
jgi:putative transposase